MKDLVNKILRGMVIGLANIIPGVSGGTMMVSMGIYDTLIYSITHLFKEFWKSVKTLLPYLAGMVAAIILGAFGLKAAFNSYPLPTNALFIGLILGSIPAIIYQMKGEKTGVTGAVIFLLLFALVVVLKVIEGNTRVALGVGVLDLIKYFFLGALASATMVIPGVSGSMILKTLGYYEPIVTDTLPEAIKALTGGNWGLLGHDLLILLPFGIGIVVGIFAIAKLIEVLLKKWKGYTYCGILGMVAASPIVIMMDKNNWQVEEPKGSDTFVPREISAWLIVAAVAALIAGLFIAWKLAGDKKTDEKVKA